jgi:uncharacterized protein YndB with AHSA1/START domain
VALNLRSGVTIRAAPDGVFELICTPERVPEWNVSIDTARRLVPGAPVCLGSRAIFSGRLLGQPLESETEVVDFEPPRLFVTRAIRGPRLTTRFELEEHGTTTQVHVQVSGEVPGGALGSFVAEGFLRKELAASLDRLKLLGESSASASQA